MLFPKKYSINLETSHIATTFNPRVILAIAKWDSPIYSEGCPIKDSDPGALEWDNSPKKDECPIQEPSAGAGSGPIETMSHSPRAREERTPEEVQEALDQAQRMWE